MLKGCSRKGKEQMGQECKCKERIVCVDISLLTKIGENNYGKSEFRLFKMVFANGNSKMRPVCVPLHPLLDSLGLYLLIYLAMLVSCRELILKLYHHAAHVKRRVSRPWRLDFFPHDLDVT